MQAQAEIDPDAHIAAGLTAIRKRRRWFWVVVLTFMPGMFGIGGLLASTTGWADAPFVVAAAWMVAFWVAGNCRLPLRSSRPAT